MNYLWVFEGVNYVSTFCEKLSVFKIINCFMRQRAKRRVSYFILWVNIKMIQTTIERMITLCISNFILALQTDRSLESRIKLLVPGFPTRTGRSMGHLWYQLKDANRYFETIFEFKKTETSYSLALSVNVLTLCVAPSTMMFYNWYSI